VNALVRNTDSAPVAKLCKDCAHCVRDDRPERADFARCEAPENSRTNLVLGGSERRFTYCTAARLDGADSCGTAGTWFEPKQSPSAPDSGMGVEAGA